MKTRNLLEQLIRKIIVEQEDNTVSDVDIEDPGKEKTIARHKLIPASRSGLDNARQHGAVKPGWSAFKIKSNFKPGDPGNIRQITDNDTAFRAIARITVNDPKGQYYGESGQFKGLVNDVPKYMYIVGPDISKRKRVQKYNVWVCNFEQLYNISKQLDNTQPLQFYRKIDDLVEDKGNRIGDVIVFSSLEVRNWFSALKQRMSQSKLDVKPINSTKLIPEIDYLAKDYDPDDEDDAYGDVDLTPYEIQITDTNDDEYNTSFRGSANISRDTFGNRILIPINGKISVFREGDGMHGTFVGEFKNGAPYNGTVTWDDDTQFTGKIKDVRITIEPDGSRQFHFNTDGAIPIEQAAPAVLMSTTPPEASAENENNPITFPYADTWEDGDLYTIITTGDTDPYVYFKDSRDGWYYTKRENVVERHPTVNWMPIANKKAINTLDKIKNTTADFNEKASASVKSPAAKSPGYKTPAAKVPGKTPENSAESTPTPGTITYPYTWKSSAGTFNVITTSSQPGQVFYKDKNQWYSSNQSKFEAAEKSPNSVSLSILPVTNSKLAAELNNVKTGTKTKSVAKNPTVPATTKVTFKKSIGNNVALYNWNATKKTFENTKLVYSIEKSYKIQNLAKSTNGSYTKIKFAGGEIYWVLSSELK
jgi:hypothetical protein